MNKKTQSKIVDLRDSTSWMNRTVELLISNWKKSNYVVLWAHSLQGIAAADYCFCLSFSKILKKEIRNLFHHTLVVHASDLPSGKG